MSRGALVLLLSGLVWGCGQSGAQEWEACVEDGDCVGDLVCKAGICMQAQARVACLVDGQCPEGASCVDGFCTWPEEPAGCSEEQPCPDGQDCVDGDCVEREEEPECGRDKECDGTKWCRDGVCVEREVEPECSTDEECESGSCDREAGKCLEVEPRGCEEDGDCLGGICNRESGQCEEVKPECTDDEECESGVCDVGAGKCIEDPAECNDMAQCDDSDPCTADSCKDGKCKNTHVAGDGCCLTAGDCPAPTSLCLKAACVDWLCQEQEVVGCCTVDGQCDDGDGATVDSCQDNTCVHQVKNCEKDADCNDSNPCTIDSCPDGSCKNIKTADPLCCVTDKDCNDNKPETTDVCVNNVCTFKGSNACLHDGDCADSNPCTTEKCSQQVCEFTPIKEPQCACGNAKECFGKGDTCVLVQSGVISIATYCSNPVGPKKAGEACAKDGDCMTNFCAEFDDGSICFGPCKDDSDCFGGSECGKVNFTLSPGKVVTLNACVIPPDLCNGDADCSNDLVCVPGLNPDMPNSLLTFCAEKIGAKAGGAMCGADDDCQSGICFNLYEKGIDICWSACATDKDCLPGLFCYAHLIYQYFDQGTTDKKDDKWWGIDTCAPSLGTYKLCNADSECPAGEFCHTYTNKTNTALEPRCITAKGATGAGGSCTVDSQCKSNWCNPGGPGSLCIGLCKTTGECSGGTTCKTYDEFVFNSKGDSQAVKLCLP